MRAHSARVWMALLLGVVLLPRPALPGAAEDPIEELVQRVQDEGRDDETRIAARDRLVKLGSTRAEVREKLVALGKATKSDNVRVHVAIALAELGRRQPDVVTANLDLLAGWLNEGTDLAVRYWAARAIARSKTPQAFALLNKALEEQKAEALRTHIALALGESKGEEALGVLLKLLSHPKPDLRIAAIEGIRAADPDRNVPVINALLKAAREDKDEAVWRAAALALRALAPGDLRPGLSIRPGATEEQRQEILGAWSLKWARWVERQQP